MRVAAAIVVALCASGCIASSPPAPPAPPAPSGPSCAGTPVEGVIVAAFAGTGQEAKALEVAWRESRCDPGARNPSGASGLFQMMLPLHSGLFWQVCLAGPAAWADPWCNAQAARLLYDGSGWRPWVTA